MLKKLTLTFKDGQLENSYQEYITNIIRKPLLFKLSLNSTAFILISLIQHLIQETGFLNDTYQILIFGFKVLQVIFFIYIYQKKPTLIKWVILFYNHVLLIYYYNTNELKPKEQILAAQGIACLQIINALSGEFIVAIYQIIVFCSCYFIFAILEDHSIDYSFITQVLSAIMIFSSIFYQNIKALRSQFQLSNLDNQWEFIFQKLVKDQYLIFSYNEHLQCFSLKNMEHCYKNIQNNDQLKNFLRKIRYSEQQNLEQMIFHQIKNNVNQRNIINETQMIQGKQFKLNYSIFYGAQIIILLQIQNEFMFQKQQQYSVEKMYQSRFKKFILQIKNVLIQKQNKKFPKLQLSQVRKYCLYAYLKDLFYIHTQDQLLQSLQLISIKSIFCSLKSIYYNKEITYESYVESDIISCKQIILIVLIEIIERSLSKFISLRFEKIGEDILQINVYCLFEAKQIDLSFLVREFPKLIILIKGQRQCIFLLYQDICTQFKISTKIMKFEIQDKQI